jgi:hypothetical protein
MEWKRVSGFGYNEDITYIQTQEQEGPNPTNHDFGAKEYSEKM